MTTFLVLSLLSGSGHIFFDYQKNLLLTYLLKPLTILIIMAAVCFYSTLDLYGQLILVGLGFSLLGDIFLMLKKQKFIPGLVSFLVAHIVYVVAFVQLLSDHPSTPAHLLYFALPGLAVYSFLYPGLGKLKLPVLVYVSAIMLMGFFSLEVYLANNNSFALSALIGAMVFMISDATLAINKFRQPFKAAQGVILSTYYVAQWLIAYSTFG